MNDRLELQSQLAASNIKEFADLIREMRLTQTEYFKTRSPQTLRVSKQLEKIVDRTVDLIIGDTPQKEMPL